MPGSAVNSVLGLIGASALASTIRDSISSKNTNAKNKAKENSDKALKVKQENSGLVNKQKTVIKASKAENWGDGVELDFNEFSPAINKKWLMPQEDKKEITNEQAANALVKQTVEAPKIEEPVISDATNIKMTPEVQKLQEVKNTLAEKHGLNVPENKDVVGEAEEIPQVFNDDVLEQPQDNSIKLLPGQEMYYKSGSHTNDIIQKAVYDNWDREEAIENADKFKRLPEEAQKFELRKDHNLQALSGYIWGKRALEEANGYVDQIKALQTADKLPQEWEDKINKTLNFRREILDRFYEITPKAKEHPENYIMPFKEENLTFDAIKDELLAERLKKQEEEVNNIWSQIKIGPSGATKAKKKALFKSTAKIVTKEKEIYEAYDKYNEAKKALQNSKAQEELNLVRSGKGPEGTGQPASHWAYDEANAAKNLDKNEVYLNLYKKALAEAEEKGYGEIPWGEPAKKGGWKKTWNEKVDLDTFKKYLASGWDSSLFGYYFRSDYIGSATLMDTPDGNLLRQYGDLQSKLIDDRDLDKVIEERENMIKKEKERMINAAKNYKIQTALDKKAEEVFRESQEYKNKQEALNNFAKALNEQLDEWENKYKIW